MSDSNSWVIPVLLCFCGALFVVAVGGGIIAAIVRSTRGVKRGWGELATRHGLAFTGAGMFSSPELKGEFRHRPIHVYTYSAGTQGNRSTYTAVALSVNNPTNSTFEVTPSGTVGNVLGKMVKAQDVEIGNAEFDPRFVIKSNPPDFAAHVLRDSPAQTAIMEIPGHFRIELQGGSLKYSKGGTEESADFLSKIFGLLSDLADRFERPEQPAANT